MAKGIVTDSIQNARTLALAHTAQVAKGDIIVNNGMILVAVNDAAANAPNVYVWTGKCIFPKATGTAMAPGDKLYWDNTAFNVTKTVGTNTRCGMCVEAALAADTSVVFMLFPVAGLVA
jgi:predicted RecA/RadA family phage recombinase